MQSNQKIFIIIISFLIAGILIAGCTDSKGSSNTTQAAAVTSASATVGTGPHYSAGDIVRNPKSTSTTAWLVLGYDSSTDMYERALIYPNSDGSWGYRMNTRTEKSARLVMDQVYTEKVDHVDPSAVPTGALTTATTPVVTSTTEIISTGTTTTTTTTTTGKPSIRKILPDSGTAGTSVAVTDLAGQNFATGATVKLSKSGNPDIVATSVQVSGGTDITCTLPIPVTSTPGAWDVVVTNPDGQSATYTNIFSVHYDPSVAATSSGSSGGSGMISSIDPITEPASGDYPITIVGSNFLDGITATLKKSGKPDITARTCIRSDTTRMQCYFNIPLGSNGYWDMVVTNTNGTTGTLLNALTVNS
jgi:hypothetical protein